MKSRAASSQINNKLIEDIVSEGKSLLMNAEGLELLSTVKDSSVRVKMALLDPPYNRRTKFHHYDDSMCRDKWVDALDHHCRLIRDCLTEDGSLWLHIDDAEMIRARIVLDRIFGEKNFIASIVWQKSVSRDNRTSISTTHEYILVYAKDKNLWKKTRNKLPPTDDQLGRYKNKDNDPRGPWTSGDLTAKAGPGRREAQFYDLELPSGRVVRPSVGTAWRFTKERLEEMIADNRIYFGGGNSMPRLKRFLTEVDPGLVPNTWWSGEEVGTADSAKKYLKALFPNLTPFETPKPEELVSRAIKIATKENDYVLDIYGGSGTTAAVATKLNRKWLTTEREERTFNEFTLPRIEIACASANHNQSLSNNFVIIR
ncbi:site-specific DNA-methyltransferase [Alteromonas australica]|uniref:site-specific DNA-methyltransferase n=1 Tax=Alteromonas australica TaxID=589873 RepID=UPI0035C87C35